MPDAQGNPVEGDVRVNRVDPSRTAVFHNGQWFERPRQRGARAGAPTAQVGTPENPDPPMAPLTPGSESRTRVALGFGPSVAGQRQMETSEAASRRQGRSGNPLTDDWGAVALEAIPWDGGAVARFAGGQDYQDYTQASAAFEAAFLPVLSGAAVTDTEARRQIRASLPQLIDTPETLRRKSRNRQMMINAAADLAGRPRPFPQAGTWDFGGQQQRPRYTATQGQARYLQNARGTPGSQTNPMLINPANEAASLRSVRPGQWYVTPGGELLRRGG